MTYNETLEYLKNSAVTGTKHGLSDFGRLLNALGNPERGINIIHTAGTNGKGSFCGYTAQILREAGFSVGVYTSPHLIRYNERFSYNSGFITDGEFSEIMSYVKNTAEKILPYGENFSFFELMTAVCFCYFKSKSPDFVILETGLGGRLDATNIVEKPLFTSIMKIGIDHTEFLGSTVEEIAAEKAGIIKPCVPCVLSPNSVSVCEVISRTAAEKGAPLICDNDMKINIKNSGIFGILFDIESRYFSYKNLFSSMGGSFQPQNIGTVLMGIELLKKQGVPISEEAVYEGIRKAKVRGRMDVISKNPLIVVDGAHNLNAACEFSETLKAFEGDKTLIVGVLKDKNPEKLIEKLSENADRVILTMPDSKRAFDPSSVRLKNKEVIYCKEPSDALKTALRFGGSIFSAGSLYLAGEILKITEGEFYDRYKKRNR